MLVMLCRNVAQTQNPVRTANDACQIWLAPPGFSNPSDNSYSLCALDRHPRRLSGPDMPPPTLGRYAGGDIFVVIRPDGAIDSALTRPWTAIGDTSFENHMFEAVRRWRFEPPLRNGVPVRAGLTLSIVSTARDDTIPQHLEWRYLEGHGQDTAIARWVVDSVRPPPLTSTQADSVYAAVFRQLVRLQVLPLNPGLRYCLLPSSGDTLSAQRVGLIARKTLRRGPAMTTSAGCERNPEFLRFVTPTVYRTERDRVVVFPRGDFLPVWPWGFDARSWRAWSGRCVGRMFADGHAAMGCGVNPMSMGERMSGRTIAPDGPPWVEGDSVRFTIVANRSGAFLVDTLNFAVGPLPILEQHAVVDSLMPCGNWAGFTQTDNVFVVHGAVGTRSFAVDAVSHTAPPASNASVGCPRRTAGDGPFAAFLLDGVGARATAPVHLCISDCAYRYTLSPERGTFARVAAIRVSDLRHESQLGTFDQLRILMDHGPSDVTVLVAYRSIPGWPMTVDRAFHAAERRWDFGVNFGGTRPDIEFWVYMFRRVAPSRARSPGS